MALSKPLEQIRGAILTEAQKNEQFRNELLARPKEAIEKRFHITLPENLDLEVKKKDAAGKILDLQFNPRGGLSLEELEKVAGGLVEAVGHVVPSTIGELELQREVNALKGEVAKLEKREEIQEIREEVERGHIPTPGMRPQSTASQMANLIGIKSDSPIRSALDTFELFRDVKDAKGFLTAAAAAKAAKAAGGAATAAKTGAAATEAAADGEAAAEVAEVAEGGEAVAGAAAAAEGGGIMATLGGLAESIALLFEAW